MPAWPKACLADACEYSDCRGAADAGANVYRYDRKGDDDVIFKLGASIVISPLTHIDRSQDKPLLCYLSRRFRCRAPLGDGSASGGTSISHIFIVTCAMATNPARRHSGGMS